jgi:hypothetical protein
MKFLKKLSLQHLTLDQLNTVLVLSAGAALLVLASLSLAGEVQFTFDNAQIKQALSNPTSLGASMAWAATSAGGNLPAWDSSTGKNAAQNPVSSGEWSSPRACRFNPDGNDREKTCTKEGPADWRRYAVFSIHEKGNATNGKKATLVGQSTGNRTDTPNWNGTWNKSISEPSGTLTIDPTSEIILNWTCQDSQINYFEDECGLGGLNMCESTRAGLTRDVNEDPILFFDGVGTGGSGFDATARKGTKTITPPYGTTNYRVTCQAISSSSYNVPLNISVYRPVPTVTIVASDPNAGEPNLTGTYTLTRTGGTAMTYPVNFTVSGTAVRGTDYNLYVGGVLVPGTTGGTITFPTGAGGNSVVVSLVPVDNPPAEPTETATMTLATGGAATINITDNDACPAGQSLVGASCVANATANLTATPLSVTQGSSATFTWSSSSVSSCSIAKASAAPWNPASTATSIAVATANATGVGVTFPTIASYTYTLNCISNNGTANPSDSVVVTVTSAPAPTANISAAVDTVASGGSTTLTWSCTNSTTGRVTNNRNATVWNTLTSAGQSTGALTQSTTYVLRCTNSAGAFVEDTQLVEVCTSTQHVEGGNCVANTRTCTPLNAPANSGTQTWNGTAWGACIADSGETPQGNCNPGYHIEGVSCVIDVPTLTLFVASPFRVQKGADTTLTWEGTELPATCQLTSNPAINDTDGANDTPRDVASEWTGNSPGNGTGSGAVVGPIQQTTIFTLNCGSGQAQKTVTVVPNVTEI